MSCILLVEDTVETKDLVSLALGKSVEVVWAENLASATKILQTKSIDLILLDVGLPDGDGFQFFSLMQNDDVQKEIPVIFLTARDSVSDKVLGISLGAEDYLSKPFAPAELRARVESRLKKRTTQKASAQTLHCGPFEINLAEQRVYTLDGKEKRDLELTQLELKILVTLTNNEETLFSRDQLLSAVWGQSTFLTDRVVDTHIYSLRKKLGVLSDLIESVYGQGYRFSQTKKAA